MNNKIKLSITGKNPTYFLKEIIKRKINIYKVEKEYNQLRIIIEYQDLEEIMNIKTTYKIKVIERYGLCRYQFLFKKYLVLIMFFIMGILINIVLSNMIFNIEVVHSNKELINTVKKDLKELGLKKYHLKVDYKTKEKIKEKLLVKEKDLLEWVEIEEKGTKYIVKVEQRKKNKVTKQCNPRHIVSKKNALIYEIEASSGEIVKKKNDYTSKGEVIISGLIHNKENIVSKRCSSGKVYGEVWYTVTASIPKKIHTSRLTSDESYGLSVKTLNKEYNFLNKFSTYQKNAYNIIESDILPINIAFTKFIKTSESTKNITPKNAEEEAIKATTKEIEKRLKKDEKIISKKVLKKTEINSKIKVEIFFKVKENITDYQDITNLDIEKINNEKEE